MTAAGAPRLAYRAELDGLRGVAVLLVFLQHAQLAGFRHAGWVGVTMFFTLSGYLITSLLLVEDGHTGRIHLGRFYFRRALRLLPALVVVLLAVGILAVVVGRDFWAQELATLLYVSNWANVAGLEMWYLGHTWSLAIEEQFYILWPLALVFVRSTRWRVAMCVIGVIVSVALRAVLFGPDAAAESRWSHGLDTRGDALLVGCLLALVRWSAPGWVGWIGILGLAGTLAFLQPTAELAYAGLVIAAASTALIMAAGTGATLGPLVALGGISYGVYLWHFPIIEGTRWLAATVPGPVLVLGWFLATLAAAFASRRLVELPALRFRNRSFARAADEAAPS
ncbi:MAG: acyltransferase [Chloroflexota bacterium]